MCLGIGLFSFIICACQSVAHLNLVTLVLLWFWEIFLNYFLDENYVPSNVCSFFLDHLIFRSRPPVQLLLFKKKKKSVLSNFPYLCTFVLLLWITSQHNPIRSLSFHLCYCIFISKSLLLLFLECSSLWILFFMFTEFSLTSEDVNSL